MNFPMRLRIFLQEHHTKHKCLNSLPLSRTGRLHLCKKQGTMLDRKFTNELAHDYEPAYTLHKPKHDLIELNPAKGFLPFSP